MNLPFPTKESCLLQTAASRLLAETKRLQRMCTHCADLGVLGCDRKTASCTMSPRSEVEIPHNSQVQNLRLGALCWTDVDLPYRRREQRWTSQQGLISQCQADKT